MFTRALVKRPAKSLIDGITSAPQLGKPDYQQALHQHDAYIEALKQCGLHVTVLEADENFPDSCFVEDAAVITPKGAIVSRPGADSRRREAALMAPELASFFDADQMRHIESPGTLEGGDVMMVGDHYYVGLSDRTNEDGAQQFIQILEGWGLMGSAVPLKEMLHLKTGVNYLENNNMLVCGEFVHMAEFDQYNKIVVPEAEAYAANCVWVNGKVIVPMGYPQTEQAICDLGYELILVDTSEYKKLDGGLSCLSLRF